MNSYKFFQNTDCKYFPCHKGIEIDNFNCLFCFCPIYALGENCKGHFSYKNKKGVKDCSGCVIPHKKESYDQIIEKCSELVEMVRHKDSGVDE